MDSELWSTRYANQAFWRDLNVKGACLKRFISSFPADWPGIGLLLLRALIGVQLIVLGLAYVEMENKGFGAWTIALFTLACGALLLCGLMTPLVSVIVALGGLGVSLSLIPLPNQTLFRGSWAMVDLIVLALAVATLGPGAFSLDARMFGRREITIPVEKH